MCCSFQLVSYNLFPLGTPAVYLVQAYKPNSKLRGYLYEELVFEARTKRILFNDKESAAQFWTVSWRRHMRG